MYIRSATYLFILLILISLPQSITTKASTPANQGDEFLIVDCLLPGQLRKLGRKAVYQTARRPIKTSARNCEIRGGEYVAFDRSSYASALKVWLPQAQGGNPEAQTYVGEIYEKGLGLPPDYVTAAQWYQKAADKGYSTAQINLGHMYEKGLGITKDPQKALYWYRQSSGLSDEMAFVPTKELEGLKQEAEESKREAESLKLQLKQSNQELSKIRQHVQKRKRGVESQQQKLEETRRELDKLREQAVTSTNDTELNDLKSRLNERENELENNRLQITQIEKESKAYKNQLDLLNQGSSDVQQYKKQAQQNEQEAESLRRQLAEAQAELTKKKNEAQSRQQKIKELRSEFDQRILKVESSSANEEEIKKLRVELNKRQSELESQNQGMNELRKQVTELEANADSQSKKIASLQKSGDAVQGDDPRIEMIDPKIKQLTRGIQAQIKTRSGASRTIVGKLIATYGVQSFTVNGIDEKLNDNGIFKFKKSVQSSDVPIKLVAVDNKGNSTVLEFVLTPKGKVPENIADEGSDLNFGNYYAVIIGNDQYINPGWPDLKTPTYDASIVAKVLREKYGFKTKVLKNATRSQILQVFSDYQKKLGAKDNLLIYYAGHGQIDQTNNNRGFWIPVDGEHDREINWISNAIIADYLSSIQSKHILVIADSCYAGTLTRGAMESPKMSKEAMKTMLKQKSRTALTSGDLQPVLDAGGGQNSVFAKAIIDVLKANNSILAGQNLHSKVYENVTLKVEQIPQYAPIRFAKHGGGNFLFVPTN